MSADTRLPLNFSSLEFVLHNVAGGSGNPFPREVMSGWGSPLRQTSCATGSAVVGGSVWQTRDGSYSLPLIAGANRPVVHNDNPEVVSLLSYHDVAGGGISDLDQLQSLAVILYGGYKEDTRSIFISPYGLLGCWLAKRLYLHH